MSNENNKPVWIIEERHNEFTRVMADRCRVDNGALVFEDGDVFSSTLVIACAPGTWQCVMPAPADMCTCEHDDEDDE